MEINALLLNFEKQLHISEHEKTILTGFLHFLINRCNSQNVIIPYGLLIQYDEDSSYQTFLSILESVLPQLNTKDKYLLKHATEKSLSQITLKEYFKTPKEILVLTDCEDDGSLDSIISQFQSTPDIIKIVCAPTHVIENRFRSNEHFFYRVLARHIHLEKLHSEEITCHFLNLFKQKGYTATSDFSDELAYYIESIYETADLKASEFVQDLIRRIELQMEESNGITAYRQGIPVDISFIPYSKRVLSRKQKEMYPSNASDLPQMIPIEDTQKVMPDFEENEAETHTQTHQFVPEHHHTNVLLLALSTFPGQMKKNKFEYNFNGHQGTVIGRYQLDPIPKMLDELLAESNENLDKIIMLCTDKTLKETSITTPENIMMNISPLEYFKNQIRNYMNPNLSDDERFTPITFSLFSPYDGIQQVIDTLRGIKNPVLYLDTHGGIRGIQRIMEATISLLKIEDIHVKDAFSVEFSEKSKNSIITSETENLKIFDFVSGINEFISSGRANTLMSYSSSHSKMDSSEQDFINAIQNVANGIQWCCIPEFENGLKNLQTFFSKNARAKTTDINTSYLEIYKTDIKKDYKKLVTQHNVADEIAWCREKGFYQQALTLIESRVSLLLIEDWKVLKINPSYTPVRKGKTTCYKVSEEFAPATVNDFFNAFVYRITTDIVRNDTTGLFLTRPKFNQLTEQDYTHFLNALQTTPRFLTSPAAINNYLKNALKHPTVSLKNKTQQAFRYVNVPECIIISDSIDQTVLFQLLILHKTLKDVRNTMNHASSELNYKLDAIVLALKYYMIWLEQINPNQN